MLAHNKIITEGRTLTESDLVFFSYFTGDWFYLHTDKEAAKKPFSGKGSFMVTWSYLSL